MLAEVFGGDQAGMEALLLVAGHGAAHVPHRGRGQEEGVAPAAEALGQAAPGVEEQQVAQAGTASSPVTAAVAGWRAVSAVAPPVPWAPAPPGTPPAVPDEDHGAPCTPGQTRIARGWRHVLPGHALTRRGPDGRARRAGRRPVHGAGVPRARRELRAVGGPPAA